MFKTPPAFWSEEQSPEICSIFFFFFVVGNTGPSFPYVKAFKHKQDTGLLSLTFTA